jgi:hypothetical protein
MTPPSTTDAYSGHPVADDGRTMHCDGAMGAGTRRTPNATGANDGVCLWRERRYPENDHNPENREPHSNTHFS